MSNRLKKYILENKFIKIFICQKLLLYSTIQFKIKKMKKLIGMIAAMVIMITTYGQKDEVRYNEDVS